VAAAGEGAATGHNVVIHEFVHKIDMHDIALGEHPGGSPPLPRGFLGHARSAAARAHWQEVMRGAFDRFREAVSLAERFGGEPPWLDDYAAHSPAEFFAVTCEAYFVSRPRFAAEFPELVPLYDGLFEATGAGRSGGRAGRISA
jgi:Mlc titration factor MtfA (ptsG expression regulator)